MNSIRETQRDLADKTMQSLMEEAAANIRARQGEPVQVWEPVSVDLSNIPDLNRCAVCLRPFHNASEYLNCKACEAHVCRAGHCKNLHHADHRVAYLKSQEIV